MEELNEKIIKALDAAKRTLLGRNIVPNSVLQSVKTMNYSLELICDVAQSETMI